MLHIAICDDSPDALAQIAHLTQKYVAAREIDAEIATFLHPDALLTAGEKTPFDLYLLDIVMPMISGIDVGRELRQRRSDAQMIFLTTSDEFAVEAFSLRAAHYLIKPFSHAQFTEAMNRAILALRAKMPVTLTVRTEGGVMRNVDINEIQYIESDGHSLSVHLKTEVFSETRRSLARFFEEIEKLLPGQFIQPYKGYIVNQRAIATIEVKGILLTGGARVPIPRGTLRRLRAQYVSWRFEKKGAGT